MTQKTVAFIELPAFERVYPLASGYLEAMALQEQNLSEQFVFEKHSLCINDPSVPEQVEKIEADIYAISCYVWNMGFIKRWLITLLENKKNIQIILGGPQVMNKGERYLKPEYENMILCNGEGEYTFTSYLNQLTEEKPDYSKVKGISFYQNGHLVTTEKQDRIKNMNDIPSPYLEGLLNPEDYVWALIETTRGCPFKCTYCFWGAATNAQVYKTDLDRVKAEITWLCENKALYLFIADANFGMLKRDVEIAQHLADCKKETDYPLTVYFSSSKNTPERVTEITKILSGAGLVATQPVSLQTMDANTLANVQRDNIKQSSYTSLQEELNKSKLSSFIEMIWPLPGETLETFKSGLAQLCQAGADSFIIYPLLLINNVQMDNQRDEFELLITEDPDPNSEAQIVIGNKDVPNVDYENGVRFSYHVSILFSLRGLRFTGQHLDATGKLSFHEFFSAFASFCENNLNNPYVDYLEQTIRTSAQNKYSTIGGVLHVALHQNRPEFDQLLFDFLNSLNLLDDDTLRFIFELDLLNRPYVYSNTTLSHSENILTKIKILSKSRKGCTLEIPEAYKQLANDILRLDKGSDYEKLSVRYRVAQMPYMKGKSLDDNYSYCQDKLHKMTSILPEWSVV